MAKPMELSTNYVNLDYSSFMTQCRIVGMENCARPHRMQKLRLKQMASPSLRSHIV